ncbi:MAG: SDR family NAD(P)-dependent oxidoreductase [Bdellovibrionota bacterium]
MADKIESKTQTATPIAIIGMGCLFPDAGTIDEFWLNIKEGKDSIKQIPASHWRPEDYFDADVNKADHTYAKTGAFLSPFEFDPMSYGIAPNAIEATDTTQLLAMAVAQQALIDAGYGPGEDFDRDRVSCIVGVTGTLELVIPLGARLGHPIWRRALTNAGIEGEKAEQVINDIANSYVSWQENSFPGLLGNVVAGRIANSLNLGGTNCVVDAACASSLSALSLACLELQSGKSDMVVSGGFDTFNDVFMYMCFSKTPALSSSGHARPFDQNADGTILGEGLGCVILKRLDDAERDGDRIYAIIKGIGSSSDGKGQAIYAPSAKGQAKALTKAYREAGCSPKTISLVEAHGTGTKVGDSIELEALTNVYGGPNGQDPWCALGSVKSQIGHTKAAAGAAGLIKAALSLYHKVLPPTIKVDEPNRAIQGSPFFLNREPRPWIASDSHPRRAAVSALGFGGSNFHCVLEEYQGNGLKVDWDGEVQILAFSSQDIDTLILDLSDLKIEGADWNDFRVFAHKSRSSFQIADPFRLLLVITHSAYSEAGRLVKQISDTLIPLQSMDCTNIASYKDKIEGVKDSLHALKGCYFSAGKNEGKGKLAFLFPGQGSQYPNMLKSLACCFPEVRRAFSLLDSVGKEQSLLDDGVALSDIVYPMDLFRKEALVESRSALRSTDVAQAAIGAVSLGCLGILERFGVRADLLAGHSFGELTALYAAGSLSHDDYIAVACKRGSIMAKQAVGAMLAVSASKEDVERAAKEFNLKVTIANHNAPRQVVVSGLEVELEKARSVFKELGYSAASLPVGAAFHSPHVLHAQKPFYQFIEGIEITPPRTAVYSNEMEEKYPSDPGLIAKMLSTHIVSPVSFVGQIEKMYRDGARVFVEVGPGRVLTGLVEKILGIKAKTIAFDVEKSSNHMVHLAELLAQLATTGYGVDLSVWDADFAHEYTRKFGVADEKSKAGKKRFTVMLTGANYRNPDALNATHKSILQPQVEGLDDSIINKKIENIELKHDVHVVTNERYSQKSPTNTVTDQKRIADMSKDIPMSQQNKSKNYGGSEKMLGHSEAVDDAFRLTQKSLLQLQNMQKQNAELHRQFLQGQQEAQAMFHQIMQQQLKLMGAMDIKTQSPLKGKGFSHSPLNDEDFSSNSFKSADLAVGKNENKIDEYLVVEEPSVLHHNNASLAMENNFEDQASKSMNGDSDIGAAIFDVISEKTGYPKDVLQVEMSLESDLGIDSIKRVEIFSAIQEKLNVEGQNSAEELNSLRTINDIIDCYTAMSSVRDQSSSSAIDSERNVVEADPLHGLQKRQGAEANADELSAESISRIFFNIIAEKTGYPLEMLTADMEMEADLGIDSIKRVEIFSALQEKTANLLKLSQEALAKFRTISDVLSYYENSTMIGAEAEDTIDDPISLNNAEMQSNMANQESEKKKTIRSSQAVEKFLVITRAIESADSQASLTLSADAMILIAGVDAKQANVFAKSFVKAGLQTKFVDVMDLENIAIPEALSGIVILAPDVELQSTDSREFLLNSFLLSQKVHDRLQVSASGDGAFFVTVTFNGGSFGLNGIEQERHAIYCGLAGLSKTVSHEWKNVNAKAIDLYGIENADKVVEQCLLRGILELGLSDTGLKTVALQKDSKEYDVISRPLNKNDVLVVTGGARGVTFEACYELVKEYQCRLILLGRSPVPDPEPHWLIGVRGETEIKKAIIKNADQSLPLKNVEDKYRQIMSWRYMEENFDRLRQLGCKFVYRSVDIRNEQEVKILLSDLQSEFGLITGFIHGAGVLRDKLFIEKTKEQFSDVFDTKVKGYQSIMSSLDQNALKVVVMFSSSTARFGRKGQVDYAVANEVLNKLAQNFATKHVSCRVLSANWGPWMGGMVNPSLKKMFESEGVSLIPLDAGGRYLVEALAQPVEGQCVEVVVFGPNLADQKPKDTREKEENIRLGNSATGNSMRLAFEINTSVEELSFLRDHAIDGNYVLPAAVMVEWMAHAALLANPGLVFGGLRNFQVANGIRVRNTQGVMVGAWTDLPVKTDNGYLIRVELKSLGSNGRGVVHAFAHAFLAEAPLERVDFSLAPIEGGYNTSVKAAYEKFLFHGASLQGIKSIAGYSSRGMAAKVATSPHPSKWMTTPLRTHWVVDPLVLDCVFQMMILWSVEQDGLACLPSSFATLEVFSDFSAQSECEIQIEIRDIKNANYLEANVEVVGECGNLLAKVTGLQCTRMPTLLNAFGKQSLKTSDVNL